MERYDYLIVGAGLFGAVFAHEAKLAGKRCLVIDKRAHRGGNIYCEDVEVFVYISMGLISFIRTIKMFGIM